MSVTVVQILHPACTFDHIGFIPTMLSEDDERRAVEQLDANYVHGGGWQATTGFTMNPDLSLSYPGDPDYAPLAMLRLRDERIVIYEYGFVAVIQTDGTFEAARMD